MDNHPILQEIPRPAGLFNHLPREGNIAFRQFLRIDHLISVQLHNHAVFKQTGALVPAVLDKLFQRVGHKENQIFHIFFNPDRRRFSLTFQRHIHFGHGFRFIGRVYEFFIYKKFCAGIRENDTDRYKQQKHHKECGRCFARKMLHKALPPL